MEFSDMKRYVDDRPDEGVFRVHRDVFSDPALFELEQRLIFERTWCFLGLESQIARARDFLTNWIGRTPILVSRNDEGAIAGFINVCRHKAVLLRHEEEGNAGVHVCPYHGWSFDTNGRNVHVKNAKTACYPAAFDAENHDLLRLPRIATYRGFIFGSLSADVPDLGDFLGDMRFFIDLIADQGPQGVELVPGRAVYTYNANWKLQLDNGVDPYHLTSTHAAFLDVQAVRRKGEGNVESRSFDWRKRDEFPAGAFNFRNGHSAVWMRQPEPEKRPIAPAMDEIRARVGEQRAEWMLNARNLQFFPNMQVADAISPMLRTFRPLAVDRTEMRAWCLAPIGESRTLRAWRLRQYEDFFNPGGMATPDDTIIYEEAQRGMGAFSLDFLQGYSRGLGAAVTGGGDAAAALGLDPATSVQGRYDMYNEVAFHGPYREWARLMEAGLAGKGAWS
jgi:phenylpropionate dioxygenase-like ring-hydroxylating dioxygenase large terminal subunit